VQRYILGRVAQSLVALFGITIIIFVLSRLSGDPVALMMGDVVTAEDLARMRAALGLDKPLLEQYRIFLGNAVQGDFGNSLTYRQPASSLILHRFPATIQLGLTAMAIAVAVAVPAGVWSAIRRDGVFDRFGKVVALLGQSMPGFWLGLMLILLFAVTLRLLPAGGREGPRSVILPAITLGVFPMAAIMRLTRSSLLDVLDSEYVKMARIKGLPEYVVVLKHALKNGAIPVVTLTGLQLAGFLTGSVIAETVFAWPGVGKLAVDAVFARDFNVIQASVSMVAVVFLGLNLAVDLVYAYLDPRIRYR
jgi:peptide/nickel transport system permease protein